MNRHGSGASRTAVLVAAMAATLVLVALLSVHVVSQTELARGRDGSLPLSTRLSATRQAIRLEPWRRDAASEAALLEATMLRHDGDLDGAKRVLKAAYLRDRDNTELRRVLSEVNREIETRDARKAHQQHGHEGPGGSLAPEDVER